MPNTLPPLHGWRRSPKPTDFRALRSVVVMSKYKRPRTHYAVLALNIVVVVGLLAAGSGLMWAGQRLGARQVEKGLVDGERLDQGRQGVHVLADLAADFDAARSGAAPDPFDVAHSGRGVW